MLKTYPYLPANRNEIIFFETVFPKPVNLSYVFLGFSLLDGAGFSARLLAHRADSIEAVFRHLQQFLLGG